MYQEIVVASGPRLTLELPAELVGKRLRVLAFEESEGQRIPTEEPDLVVSTSDSEKEIAEIERIFDGARVNLSNFKFDRNEANNYDD